jgi:hypothetical protein
MRIAQCGLYLRERLLLTLLLVVECRLLQVWQEVQIVTSKAWKQLHVRRVPVAPLSSGTLILLLGHCQREWNPKPWLRILISNCVSLVTRRCMASVVLLDGDSRFR